MGPRLPDSHAQGFGKCGAGLSSPKQKMQVEETCWLIFLGAANQNERRRHACDWKLGILLF